MAAITAVPCPTGSSQPDVLSKNACGDFGSTENRRGTTTMCGCATFTPLSITAILSPRPVSDRVGAFAASALMRRLPGQTQARQLVHFQDATHGPLGQAERFYG